MKKILMAIMIGLFVIAMAPVAMAEQVDVYDKTQRIKSVIFPVGESRYFIDGKTPGVKMDATTYVDQGRTFVPVRFLANALGVDNDHITYQNNQVKLVYGNITAEMTIGIKRMVTNSQGLDIDAAPTLKSGRTYLPARFVAEALGYDVDYQNGLVLCWPKGTEKPVSDLTTVRNFIEQPEPLPVTSNKAGGKIVEPVYDLGGGTDRTQADDLDINWTN